MLDTELVRVARRDREAFDCATWLHKPKNYPRKALSFKGEVERHRTCKDAGQWELLHFTVYKSQLAVIERALETAGLMLGLRSHAATVWK